jgi:hypothetical protein
MDGQEERVQGYAVPTYRALEDTSWYHFLHGNVPGHQIDFIYRPDVPQGPLTRQHFSHLARVMKYIEPQTNGDFAFAIGNLSRDDTQYEPGHGGLAIIFGLRIRGVTDHAGRQDPPFAHGIAAIDRALDGATLLTAAEAFHAHVLGARESESWYRAYVRFAQEDRSAMPGVIEGYVDRFEDLPQPEASALGAAWVTGGAAQPRRIVIAHEDDVPFSEIAAVAARLAAVLYRSDIRWTVISTGREDDVPNGVSVRLLARSELSAADAAGVVYELSELPDDEAEIAALLFSAKPVAVEAKRTRNWRDRYSEMGSPSPAPEAPVRRSWESLGRAPGSGGDEVSVDVDMDAPQNGAGGAPVASAVAAASNARAAAPQSVRPSPRSVRPPPAMSEPPAGDRAAMLETPIPAPAPLPVYPESPPARLVKVEAAPVPASRAPSPVAPAPGLGGSKRTLWLIVGGFCLLAIGLLAALAMQGSSPPVQPGGRAVPTGSSSAVAAPPSSATAAVPTPPVTASAASVQREPTPPASSAVPSASATTSAAAKPPSKRPQPKGSPTSVFRGPLD